MSNYVLVLDTDQQPLAPCHPARARELLRKGKAAVFRRYPFTIILNYVPKGSIRNEFSIQIDPGSKTTGIAVISHDKRGDRCILGINLEHRGEIIKKRLADRTLYRRSRRSRKTRYRQPRFLNRTKPKGWLPPSVMHRVLTTQTWVDRLMRWCPITSAKIEEVKFDTHLLKNPEVKGKGYQKGKLFGTEMREYLLYLYKHTCQYCLGVSGDKILQWEHMLPRSRGGSNSEANATLSCMRCNSEKGNLTPEEWLKLIGVPKTKLDKVWIKTLPKVIAQKKPSLRDAAAMNAIRYRLFDYLSSLGLTPTLYPGWVTKRNRLDQSYRKDHWIDAACVGKIGNVVYIPKYMLPLLARATGHGSRQMCNVDGYGFPRASPKGPSRINGFKSGDVVLACLFGRKYTGRRIGNITIRASGKFKFGKTTIPSNRVTRLHAVDGYRYSGTTYNHTVLLPRAGMESGLIKASRWKHTVKTKLSSGAVAYKITHYPTNREHPLWGYLPPP